MAAQRAHTLAGRLVARPVSRPPTGSRPPRHEYRDDSWAPIPTGGPPESTSSLRNWYSAHAAESSLRYSAVQTVPMQHREED